MSAEVRARRPRPDQKSTRLNSSHVKISYAVFCLKKKKLGDTAVGQDHVQQVEVDLAALEELLGRQSQPFLEVLRRARRDRRRHYSAFFFFNDTATTEIYTLSLHDALPI